METEVKIPARDVSLDGSLTVPDNASGIVLFLATHGPNGSLASLAGAANGYADHSPGNYTMWACFVAETFLTMLLVFTVLGATDDRAPAGFAGIPIGLILTVIILAGIPITNERGGIIVPGEISEPAATKDCAPTRTSSSTIDPIPIKD